MGGSWAKNIGNNAEIAQSVVWLPVHMGNVGYCSKPEFIRGMSVQKETDSAQAYDAFLTYTDINVTVVSRLYRSHEINN